MKTFLVAVLVALSVTAVYGYTTAGNKVYDPNGNPVLLRGICRPSLEWSQTGEHIGESDWNLMKGWGANVIRITLNQCYWAASADYGTLIDTQVNYIVGMGLGVILDLHWSNRGMDSSCDQQNMPDNNSLTFWSTLAAKYKNNPWVIFELYNEPRNVAWSVWRNGGDAGGYQTPGFQKILETVRGIASNAVIVNGLNWAYDLSGVANYALSGTHIIYGTHPYDFGGKQPSDWDSGFGFLSTTYPLIATEFGDYNCNANSYYNKFISYANAHDMSWTAWGWYPGGCSFPALINDWSGAPNGPGLVVQNALKGSKVPSGTVTSSTTAPSSTTKAPSTTASSSTSAPTSSSTSTPGTTGPASSACTFPTTTVNGCGVYVSACPADVYADNSQKYFIYVMNTGTLTLNSLTIKLTGSPTDSTNNRWNIYPQGNGIYTAELWGGLAAGVARTDGYGVVVSNAASGVLAAAAVSYNCVGDTSQTSSTTTTTQTPSTTTTKAATTTTTTTTTKAPSTTTTTSAPSTTTTTKAPTTTTATPTTTTTTTKATTTTTSSPSTTTTTTTTKAPSTTQAASTTTSAPSSGCAVSVSSFVKNSWVNGVTYTQYGLTIQNSGTKRLKTLNLSLTSATVTEAYNIHLIAGSSTQYSVDLWGGIDAGAQYSDQHGLQASGPVVNSLVLSVAYFDCF